MTVSNKPLAEISQRAIEILCRELGSVDAVRFINQFTTGHGDYTSERDALFAGETLDQIVGDIKKGNAGEDATSAGDPGKPCTPPTEADGEPGPP
jgi:hypothetical protein